MRFMAIAIVSCVSRLMAPSDMPPVQKRVRMSPAGCTSSSGTGGPAGVSSRQSRSTCAGLASKCARYASYASCSARAALVRQTACVLSACRMLGNPASAPML